ncbi:MAG: SLC13 family permease, partial [Planctomycetota bacterium]
MTTVHEKQSEPRNLIRLWLCVVVGVALWFSPTPAGLTNQAWHVFAVFAATIASFLLRPLPMGVCVLIGLLVLSTTGELAPSWHGKDTYVKSLGDLPATASGALEPLIDDVEPADRVKFAFKKALSGFADTTTWLVVAAFLVAGAMIRSGLGRRLALALIARLGGTTLGLGYGIATAEFVLGPFVPSNTARGGGVMAPIVNSLARALGNEASASRERQRPEATNTDGAARYLVLVGAHTNLVTAAMFLTGMAANPLVSKAAADVLGVEFGWGRWLLGGIVPGLVSLAALPAVLHWLTRPAPAAGAAKRQAR